MNKYFKLIIVIIILVIIVLILLKVFRKDKKSDSKESDNLIVNNDSTDVKFGKYYINNDRKLDPIEWTVIDSVDGKKLLLSKYVIDSRPFNNTNDAVAWDKSSIREWLNNDFYILAFSDSEKKNIVLTQNVAKTNPNHESNNTIGSDTEDNVFLLSYDEVSKYFPDEDDRVVKATKYAEDEGCYTNSQGNVAWWTRSPGISSTSPEYIASRGDFGIREHQIDENIIGTRPAIWVKDI